MMKRSFLISIGFLLSFTEACVNHDMFGVSDCERSGLTIELVEVLPASGCGVADGRIVVSASGGRLPYTFLWEEVTQQDAAFTSVTPGVHTIIVRDANGCDATLTNVTVMAEGLLFSAEVVEDTECLSDNGAVTIDITSGNPPYEFAIDGGPFAEESTFTNLSHGKHEILVRDVASCIVTLNVTVPRGNTLTSWSGAIQPIMASDCALSGCHNGISRPDLRIYANAKKYSYQIKALTQDRSMPFEGSLSQDQIDLIACWVDDGAPEN